MPYRITTAGYYKILILIAVIAGNITVCMAQRTRNNPNFLTSFPFTLLSGGVIILEARLDSFPDTLNFILDTGSGGISLDSSTVNQLRLPVVPTERLLRGIGSMKKISYVNNRTLHLPKLVVEHLDFHINDYDLLTSVYGVKINGIIGYSFFSRYTVKLNYDSNRLEVWKPGTVKIPKKGYLFKPIINGIPVFDATVADGGSSSARFYFDTGAGLCILMSENFEKDSSILQKGKKIITTQAEGIGGKSQMKLSTVREIKIGRYKFKKVPAHIFKDEYNVTSYPILGGLIGNDLLRRFNLILNYQEKTIHMTPNSHFREPFDYSYTGLGIYYINGDVVIEDVLENSPGEEAGLKPGDVIVAIENKINGSIQTYKNMLQTEGANLKILVSRNNAILNFKLKVKSIL